MASTAARTARAVMGDYVTTSLDNVNVWQVTLAAGTQEVLKYEIISTLIKPMVTLFLLITA